MVCIKRYIFVNGEKLKLDEIFVLYSMIFICKSQLSIWLYGLMQIYFLINILNIPKITVSNPELYQYFLICIVAYPSQWFSK